MTDGIRGGAGNSFDLVVFLWRKRRLIIGTTLLGAVVGIIAAYVIRPLYKSEVILFPAITNSVSKALLNEQSTGRDDILALGDEEDAEQLLQILNSDLIRDRSAERFDLMRVYRIREDGKHRHSELREAYEDHIKFEYTKFGSVRVEVLDEDPQRAADIANYISEQVDSVWKDMANARARKGFEIVRQKVDDLQREIEVLEDTMRALRHLGVQDYHTQVERYNEYLGAAIVKGDQRAINEFNKRFEVLAQYGGTYVTIQDRQWNEVKRLSMLRMKLEQAQADMESDLPHKFVVNRAFAPDKKSYPVRWLVVAISTVSALLLSLLLIVVQENVRRSAWTSTMDERLSFGRFFSVLSRHWRVFVLVGVAAVVLSAVCSGPSFIKPRYRSQAVVYPVNLTSYSIETRADQLLQLLESNSIRDSVIDRFDLVHHYKVDTAARGGRNVLYNLYQERVEISKTRYESVAIEVTDEDPVMARDMVEAILRQVNLLARDLQRGDSREVLVIMEHSLAQVRAKADSVEARLNELRSGSGLLEYETQTQELTKGYMRLLTRGGGQGQKDEVLRMLKELESKGGEFRTLSALNDLLIQEYSKQLAGYQQVLIDVGKELTYTNVVVHPEVSDKKVYPVRWIIVLATLVSALLLCYLLLVLREQAGATGRSR